MRCTSVLCVTRWHNVNLHGCRWISSLQKLLPSLQAAQESVKLQWEQVFHHVHRSEITTSSTLDTDVECEKTNVKEMLEQNNTELLNFAEAKYKLLELSSSAASTSVTMFSACKEKYTEASIHSRAIDEMLHEIQPYHSLNCGYKHIDFVYKILDYLLVGFKIPLSSHIEQWMNEVCECSFWGYDLESAVVLHHYELTESVTTKLQSEINDTTSEVGENNNNYNNNNRKKNNSKNSNDNTFKINSTCLSCSKTRKNKLHGLSVTCLIDNKQEKLLNALYLPSGHLAFVWLPDKYKMQWNQLCLSTLNDLMQNKEWILEMAYDTTMISTSRLFFLTRGWEYFNSSLIFTSFQCIERIHYNMVRVGIGNTKRFLSLLEGRLMYFHWELFCETILRHPVHVPITELLAFFKEHPFSPRLHELTFRFLLLQCTSRVMESVQMLDESLRSIREDQLFLLFTTLEKHIFESAEHTLLQYIKRNLFSSAFITEKLWNICDTNKVKREAQSSAFAVKAAFVVSDRTRDNININEEYEQKIQDALHNDNDELLVYLIRKYLYYTPLHKESSRTAILASVHKAAWGLLQQFLKNEKVYIKLYDIAFPLWGHSKLKTETPKKFEGRKVRGEDGLLDYCILESMLWKCNAKAKHVNTYKNNVLDNVKSKNGSVDNVIDDILESNNNNNNTNNKNVKFTFPEHCSNGEEVNSNMCVMEDIIGLGVDAGGYWSGLLKTCHQMCVALMITDADCTQDNMTNYTSQYDEYWKSNDIDDQRKAQQHLKCIMCALERVLIGLIVRRYLHISWVYASTDIYVRSFPMSQTVSRVLSKSNVIYGLMFEYDKPITTIEEKMWIETNSLSQALCNLDSHWTPCYVHCGTVERLLAEEKKRHVMTCVHCDLRLTAPLEITFSGKLLEKLQQLISQQVAKADNVEPSRYVYVYAMLSQGTCLDVFEAWDDIFVDNLHSKNECISEEKLLFSNIEEVICEDTL